MRDTEPARWSLLASASAESDFALRVAHRILEARWYRGKQQEIRDVSLVRSISIGDDGAAWLLILQLDYEIAETATYFIPIEVASAPAPNMLDTLRARETASGQRAYLLDASRSSDWGRRLSSVFTKGWTEAGCTFRVEASEVAATPAAKNSCHPLDADQTNSAWVIDDDVILKLCRVARRGDSQEARKGKHLTEAGFAGSPRWRGTIYSMFEDKSEAAVAHLHDYLPDAENAWSLALADMQTSPQGLSFAREMGQCVAALHGAFAKKTSVLEGPSAWLDADTHAFIERTQALLRRVFSLLSVFMDDASSDIRAWTQLVLAAEGRAEAILRRCMEMPIDGVSMAIHGDLHLAQWVARGKRLYIVDYEGEPGDDAEIDWRKESPLTDIAGMIRSFDYAWTIATHNGDTSADVNWRSNTSRSFLEGYLGNVDRSLVPSSNESLLTWLRVHYLRKVLYEVAYEANHRPEWLTIPLDGLFRLLYRDDYGGLNLAG